MEKISQKINNFINSLDSQKLNNGILVACSGGRDSMVLLDILVKTLPGKRIGVLYVNHNLRGDDSTAEEAFVKKIITEKYKLPLFSHSVDVSEWENCGSIENKAREIRYNFFCDILKRENYGFIATAHHQNDKIETFFLNLLRGGGLESLTSIPAVNHDIIRPLLMVTRTQINDYIKEFSLEYVEDKTNSQPLYKRNRIRNEVLPILKTLSGNLEKAFEAIFENLDNDVQFLEEETERRLKDVLFHCTCNVWCLDKRKLSLQPMAIRSRIIKKICYRFNVQPGRQLTSFIMNAKNIDIKKHGMNIQSKGVYLWFYPDDVDCDIQFFEKIGAYQPGDFAFSQNAGRFKVRCMKIADELETANGKMKIADILKKRGIPEYLTLHAKVFVTENETIAGYFCFGFFGVSTQFYVRQNENAKIFNLSQVN